MNYRCAPGNVRELEHVLERAFVVGRQSVITINDLPVDLTASAALSGLLLRLLLRMGQSR